MKKFTLIFIALVAFAWSVSAQDVEGGNSFATGAPDYVTVGATMPYYAKPDAYFHSDYTATATPAWQLTAGFVWNWSVPTKPASSTITPVKPGSTPANYVEFTFDVVGAYTLNVTEQAPASLGGCNGAVVTHDVTVIETPTYGDNWANDTYDNQCEGAAGIPALFTITPACNANDGNISLAYNMEIKTQTWDGAAWVNSKFYKTDKTSEQALALNFPSTVPEQALTAVAKEIPAAGFTYDCITEGGVKMRTVYTYNVYGLNTQISRKSDYKANSAAAVANFSYYTTGGTISADATVADQTWMVAINPAPKTGAIYHVKNDWNVN